MLKEDTHRQQIQMSTTRVRVRAVENICSSSGGAQERGDETQFTTKIGGKTSLGPSYFVL